LNSDFSWSFELATPLTEGSINEVNIKKPTYLFLTKDLLLAENRH
jgi:hypothetical protein